MSREERVIGVDKEVCDSRLMFIVMSLVLEAELSNVPLDRPAAK
jgi:hypothetical protein